LTWKNNYQSKLIPLEKAALLIKSGDCIGMPVGTNAPFELMNAVAARYEELENITVISGLLWLPFDHLHPRCKGKIQHQSLFLGPFERMAERHGNACSLVNQFSKMDYLFNERIKNNVALLECTPPDENGYLSLGMFGVMTGRQFMKKADTVIVQVNKQMPYVYGKHAQVHVDEVDYLCEKDREPSLLPKARIGEAEKIIASHIVAQIPDGATIQLGVGNVSDAVGSLLQEKNDLGVHTEMLTNSMVTLAKKGVITCARKNFHPDKMICAFAGGDQELSDYMHQNRFVEILPVPYINDPRNIGKNDNLMSINNTLMVDLTGQVCSESIGFNQFSGTGGQLDFVRGAKYSKGGKSFIALNSTAETKNGTISKITCALPPGTAITTPRTDTQYIVTEYGIVNVWGKTLPERVEALISIAHPDFRDQLTLEAKEAKLI